MKKNALRTTFTVLFLLLCVNNLASANLSCGSQSKDCDPVTQQHLQLQQKIDSVQSQMMQKQQQYNQLKNQVQTQTQPVNYKQQLETQKKELLNNPPVMKKEIKTARKWWEFWKFINSPEGQVK